MTAQLSPEASAVQAAIQRITALCKEWDAKCNILTDPKIDPNSGRFHIAVKVGEFTILNSPSPVDASEIIGLTSDQLWERLFYWSGERIKRPAA